MRFFALNAVADHVRTDNRYRAMQFAHSKECLLNEMYNTDAAVYPNVEMLILCISLYSSQHRCEVSFC